MTSRDASAKYEAVRQLVESHFEGGFSPNIKHWKLSFVGTALSADGLLRVVTFDQTHNRIRITERFLPWMENLFEPKPEINTLAAEVVDHSIFGNAVSIRDPHTPDCWL